MQQTIRNGFETNSSSSHSLTLVSELTVQPDYNIGDLEGTVLTIPGEFGFGWQWDIWDDAMSKIAYIYLDRCCHGNHDKDTVPDPESLARLCSILTTYSGKEIKTIKLSEDGYHYIDHDSAGTTSELWQQSDEAIWKFITNPGCAIRGGNDNEEGPWRIND